VRLFLAIPLLPDLAARAFRILPTSLPALRRVKAENLHITLAFLGQTPDERLELGRGVYAGLRSRGLPFDDRPLAPHLTLARVAEDASAAEAKTVGAALEGLAIEVLRFEVNEIAVVQSVLSPKGPRYTARATVPLAHP
jgi:2'-5' RNA ligase